MNQELVIAALSTFADIARFAEIRIRNLVSDFREKEKQAKVRIAKCFEVGLNVRPIGVKLNQVVSEGSISRPSAVSVPEPNKPSDAKPPKPTEDQLWDAARNDLGRIFDAQYAESIIGDFISAGVPALKVVSLVASHDLKNMISTGSSLSDGLGRSLCELLADFSKPDAYGRFECKCPQTTLWSKVQEDLASITKEPGFPEEAVKTMRQAGVPVIEALELIAQFEVMNTVFPNRFHPLQLTNALRNLRLKYEAKNKPSVAS